MAETRPMESQIAPKAPEVHTLPAPVFYDPNTTSKSTRATAWISCPLSLKTVSS